MEIRQGLGVSGGYAIAEAFVLDSEDVRIPRRNVLPKEVDGQVERLSKALGEASTAMRAQVDSLPRKLRDVAGAILEAQSAMLRDPHLLDEIASEIRKNQWTAEYAASRTMKRKVKALQDSGQAAFVQRVLSDLAQLEKAILRSLLGSASEDISHLTKTVILVARDISPAQTLGLNRKQVLGLLTEAGGPTSHTAIIARSLGIPAVVGVPGISSHVSGGDQLILDGHSGKVLINPDEETLKRYGAQARNFLLQEEKLAREQRDLPAVTTDGTRVQIHANIESPDEIEAALEYGAEGIGLYRTEFLYLEHDFDPGEQKHLEAYRRAARLIGNRRMVIRTVDLGADKMPVEGLPREDNPFLGTRAIRLCFERPEMFRRQLRAILKVASSGNVGMMIPMISSLSEVLRVKQEVEKVRQELRAAGEPAGEGMELGIMVEVPAAAVMADLLAPHVDFMSVGTNDLIAYSVAVDRKNERVAALYEPAHPAILRLLRQVIEAGERHKKSVSVCGEMSSDVSYTLLLLGMGLLNFSVVPPMIPELKRMIRSVSMVDARAVAVKAFTFDDPKATLAYLKAETLKILPNAP